MLKILNKTGKKGYEISSNDNEDYGIIQKSGTKSEIYRVGTYTV
jgi:hypothetical protein